MSTPDVPTQMATLSTRLGEPTDPTQARFTPAQLLAQMIASRNEIAEQTHCYPVKDSIDFTVGGSLVAPVSQALPAPGTPFLISATNDFIYLDSLTWNGIPLRSVRAQDWPDTVGTDDTIAGDPVEFMWFGRQLQIFRVPNCAGTILYRGWAYPPAIVIGGIDAAFSSRAADVSLWHAAMVLKGSDERSNSHEERMTNRGITELKTQYRPRGPRYVRAERLYPRARPLL